jgi:hypothetical protein
MIWLSAMGLPYLPWPDRGLDVMAMPAVQVAGATDSL